MTTAIVHDFLTQRGGAERVVLHMASLVDDPVIITSTYAPTATFPEFQRLPVWADQIAVQRRRSQVPPACPFVRQVVPREGPFLCRRRDHLHVHLRAPCPLRGRVGLLVHAAPVPLRPVGVFLQPGCGEVLRTGDDPPPLHRPQGGGRTPHPLGQLPPHRQPLAEGLRHRGRRALLPL